MKLSEKIKIKIKWDDVSIYLLYAALNGAGISFWLALLFVGLNKPKPAVIFGSFWFIVHGIVILFCLVMLPIAAYMFCVRPFLSWLMGHGDSEEEVQKILRGE